MATQPDFWGDLRLEDMRTPAAVLKEQAALLGAKTNNMLEGKINTRIVAGDFIHSFNVVVPTLDDYTYELFSVRHPIELYPVTVRSKGTTLKTEAEFTAWLREQLSSSETKRILSSLLAQATS